MYCDILQDNAIYYRFPNSNYVPQSKTLVGYIFFLFVHLTSILLLQIWIFLFNLFYSTKKLQLYDLYNAKIDTCLIVDSEESERFDNKLHQHNSVWS